MDGESLDGGQVLKEEVACPSFPIVWLELVLVIIICIRTAQSVIY